jgi:hypothetical protein
MRLVLVIYTGLLSIIYRFISSSYKAKVNQVTELPTINPGDILKIDMGIGADDYLLIKLKEDSYYNINYSEVIILSVSTLQTVYTRKRLNIVR